MSGNRMETNGKTLSAGRRALVLGFGASGAAAARLLATSGVRVAVADQGPGTASGDARTALAGMGVSFYLDTPDLPDGRFDLGVLSPGLDVASEWGRAAQRQCEERISELELGWRYCRCPVMAVTGTNGKSTLTRLLGDILASGGLHVECAGNYGPPISAAADRSEGLDWLVVEVSSFQLECVRDFHPRVGVLLNLQPDHLDRHGSLAQYFALKARLFSCMQPGDVAWVVHDRIDTIRSLATGARPEWRTFGPSDAPADLRYDPSRQAVTGTLDGQTVDLALDETVFANPVMGLTAAAAVGAARFAGIPVAAMQSAFSAFRPLSHRMEPAGSAGGILFIDDSKATNLAAVQAALAMTAGPVRLIAGGQFKEKDAQSINDVLKSRVVCAYLIGEAQSVLAQAWRSVVPCRPCGRLEEAVACAWQDAGEGDVILLSPGCASFDQFTSYADRGNQFQAFAKRILCEQNKEDET